VPAPTHGGRLSGQPGPGIVHRVPRGGGGEWWGGRQGRAARSPFTGSLSTQLVCLACKHKCPVRWESFQCLSLPLPAGPRGLPLPGEPSLSLAGLLARFTAPETVDDVVCEACRRRGRFSKRALVAKLPRTLCLHLPRTMWQESGQASKRGEHVSFPERLDMYPYTYAASAKASSVWALPARSDSGRQQYRLTAVIVHTGDASSGHFVTFRRRADPADPRWFYASDAVVSRAARSEVLAAAAYMFFYDRVTSAVP